MTTSTKVFTIVSIMLLILTLSVVSIVAYNFQQFGIKNAKEKAELTAEAVRDGLTSHMVNGIMDKRFHFLDNMLRHQDIEKLRVLRSDSVIEEYGIGLDDKKIRDSIDKMVLESGKSVSKIVDSQKGKILRVVIPYKATAYSNPNCLECHSSAKEGDVLGAISMEVDISGAKRDGIVVVARTVLVSIIFLIIAIFIAHRFISPYVKLFEDLEEGIIKAHRGDFSYHISTTLKSQAGVVAKRLNELSEIYRFKKTIEMDKDKKEVIKRLIYIFEHSLSVKNLAIFEIDHQKNTQKLFYSSLLQFPSKNIENPNLCRAFRTSRIMISTDFPDLCEACSKDGIETLCIPYRINTNYSLVFQIMSDNANEIKALQNQLPIIRNYLAIAHPVIESKILMEILEEASFKDGLTELYNRRYLNSLLDENTLNLFSKVAVLMVDIDFFKEVNDTYGHDVGDRVIKELSKVIRENLKDSDFGVRFGGEEFVLLLPECDEEEAEARAQNIKESFAKLRFDVAPKGFSKTLSVGIAIHPIDGETIWKSIKYADVALYKAKESGRNRVVRFKKEYFSEIEY